jgi:hypothetical protein
MNGLTLAALALAAALSFAWALACASSDDDDDHDVQVDDDADQGDDDAAGDDDDDDDDNDDDTTPYTCELIATSLDDICHAYIVDPEEGEEFTKEWCTLSEDLFSAKLQSPFWNCIGDCIFVGNCDASCFNACEDPPDPGGTGCDHTVDGIYGCGVAFPFEANPDYLIPQMDAAAACSGSLSDLPWACYGECVASLPCSDPPTQTEAQAMIDCMNACP